VFIDPKAVLFLLGTQMDFQTSKLASQFVFNNPNQTSACGCGESVAITPVARVEDPRWRWHVGLDVDATALLDALYRGEEVSPAELERLALLMRLEFVDPAEASAALAGRPVYLGLACRPDRTLRMKPQNLVASLPLARAD